MSAPSQPLSGPEDERPRLGRELVRLGRNLGFLAKTEIRKKLGATLAPMPVTRPSQAPSLLREGGYPSMQRVPPDQLETLKNKIEIHGSPVKVQRRDDEGEGLITIGALDVDFLFRVGLHPTRAVVADSIPFLLSDPYEHHGRLCVVAYVGDSQGEKYVARTYYLSGSHGTWRHLPGYSAYDGHFDKFAGEDQLAMPGMVQWALGALSQPDKPRVSIPEERDRDMAFYGTAREFVDMAMAGVEDNDRTIHRDVVGGRITELDDGEAEAQKTPDDLNAALRTMRQAQQQYPDVHRVLDHWEQYSPTYKRNIRVEVVPDLFREGITYHFHSMEYEFERKTRTAVWLGNGEDLQGRIGSTGLRKGHVRLGNLGAAPYEYYSQAGSYAEQGNNMSRYVGIHRNYHDHISLFQEYRRALEVRKKGNLRGNAAFLMDSLRNRGIPSSVGEILAGVNMPGARNFITRNRSLLKFTLAGALALGTVMERGHAPYRHEVVFKPGGESLYRISDRIVDNARKRYTILTGSYGDSYLVRDIMRKAVVDKIITENTRLMKEQGQEPFDENFGNIKAGLRIIVNFDPHHYRTALERVTKEVRDATNDAAILGNLTNAELDQRQRLSAFEKVSTVGINAKYRESIEQFIDGRRSYFDAADEMIGRTPFRSEVTGVARTPTPEGFRFRIGYAQESILSSRKTEQTLDIVRDIAAQDTQRQQMPRARYITLHSTITPASATKEDSERTNTALRKTLKDTGHAHYYVDEEGKVYQLYNDKTALNHAGLFADKRYGAIYQGNGSVTMESIGVEVRAPKGEAWNPKQMEAVRKLISVIGYEHDLIKKDVKRHSEIANAKNADDAQNGYRGRKSDPVGVDFAKLGLPGHPPIDPDIVSGQLGYSTQAKTHPDFALDIAMGDKGIVRTWERSEELYRAIRAANPTHGDRYRQAKPKTEAKAESKSAIASDTKPQSKTPSAVSRNAKSEPTKGGAKKVVPNRSSPKAPRRDIPQKRPKGRGK